jgi:cystathionine beta-lyase
MTVSELEARRGVKWSLHGPGQLPAWVADMDFRTAPAVLEALERLVRESDFGYAFRDGAPLGNAVARAFAERMQEKFHWEVDPARVLACTDLVQGVFDTVQAYSQRGDDILVQGPTYDPFREGIEDSGRVMVVNHMLLEDGRWVLDLDDLRAKARTSPVLMLCHPHNPTGRAFTRDELEAVAAIAVEEDLVVISDEIWADFMLDEREHIPFATLSQEIAERTVTMYSAGKSFSLAGLRCAVIHFGSQTLQQRFHEVFPPRMLGGMNVAGVEATLAAWRDGADWFDGVLATLRDNRTQVEAFVKRHCDVLTGAWPESTYLYWIDCSGLGLQGQTPAEFFKEAGVIFSAGSDFGPAYADYVRFNFATSPEVIGLILDRMTTAIDALPARG